MPKQGKGDSGFKPILIMLKDTVLLVTRSSVRILELNENDDFDAGNCTVGSLGVGLSALTLMVVGHSGLLIVLSLRRSS